MLACECKFVIIKSNSVDDFLYHVRENVSWLIVLFSFLTIRLWMQFLGPSSFNQNSSHPLISCHTTVNSMLVISKAYFLSRKFDSLHVSTAATPVKCWHQTGAKNSSGFHSEPITTSAVTEHTSHWLSVVCLWSVFCPATGSGVLACFMDLSPLGAGERLLCDWTVRAL